VDGYLASAMVLGLRVERQADEGFVRVQRLAGTTVHLPVSSRNQRRSCARLRHHRHEVVADREMSHLHIEVTRRSCEPEHSGVAPKSQRTGDTVANARPRCARHSSTIRRRDCPVTPVDRHNLDGKARGPRSGATIKRATTLLQRFRACAQPTTHDGPATSCPLPERLEFSTRVFCGLRQPAYRTPLGPSPQLSTTSIPPARRRPGRRHRRSFLRSLP
jgi:hypothetical protein